MVKKLFLSLGFLSCTALGCADITVEIPPCPTAGEPDAGEPDAGAADTEVEAAWPICDTRLKLTVVLVPCGQDSPYSRCTISGEDVWGCDVVTGALFDHCVEHCPPPGSQ